MALTLWNRKNIVFGRLDLDYAIKVEQLPTIIEYSTIEQEIVYEN